MVLLTSTNRLVGRSKAIQAFMAKSACLKPLSMVDCVFCGRGTFLDFYKSPFCTHICSCLPTRTLNPLQVAITLSESSFLPHPKIAHHYTLLGQYRSRPFVPISIRDGAPFLPACRPPGEIHAHRSIPPGTRAPRGRRVPTSASSPQLLRRRPLQYAEARNYVRPPGRHTSLCGICGSSILAHELQLDRHADLLLGHLSRCRIKQLSSGRKGGRYYH